MQVDNLPALDVKYSIMDIGDILNGVLCGKELSFEEAVFLLDTPHSDIFLLMQAGNSVREKFCGDRMDICSLINAKSGLCNEDCKFCAQSTRFRTDCKIYPLVSVRRILDAAKKAKRLGAANFCIVTSGKGPLAEEFEKIKAAIKEIRKKVGIKVDVSLGEMPIGMIRELKELGIDRFNHNLETSEDFYGEICSSHSYVSRLGMVGMLKEVGISPCCGGIIGLGESRRDRVKLAFTLKSLKIKCIPINILNPIRGTPLQDVMPLDPFEIIKTIAVFRLILRDSIIKIAGGREHGLRDMQALAFISGANGMIVGGYLTTKGRPAEKDLQMARDLGFRW